MYRNFQQQQADRKREPAAAQLATVGAVYADGITLLFDGESVATTKRYKYNRSASFSAGQRVKITRLGGTYLVDYPIGGV